MNQTTYNPIYQNAHNKIRRSGREAILNAIELSCILGVEESAVCYFVKAEGLTYLPTSSSYYQFKWNDVLRRQQDVAICFCTSIGSRTSVLGNLH